MIIIIILIQRRPPRHHRYRRRLLRQKDQPTSPMMPQDHLRITLNLMGIVTEMSLLIDSCLVLLVTTTSPLASWLPLRGTIWLQILPTTTAILKEGGDFMLRRMDEDMGWRKKQKVKGKGKQAERWDAMFDRLVQFQQEHGHCLVPNRYPEDPSLGAWVSTQRRHYKILMTGRTDQTTPMTEERASRLESIGFAWETSDPRHVPWETRFKQLLEYKERFGELV